jgi:DNA-binding LacI/PurR family transcriptional regulator
MIVQQKKLTLKDISRLLAVSTATISNAFNRPDQLSAELRRHILSECKRLGYHGPNGMARSLRTGRSGIVGIVLSDNLSYSVTDPVASEFLQGVAHEFDEQQIHMLLLSSSTSADGRAANIPDSVVDGFIIYGAPGDPAVLARIFQQNKPVVTVDFQCDPFPAVHVSNFEGALDSARHALNKKPEQVAILGLRLIDTERVCRINDDDLLDEDASVAIQRLRGYRQALGEQNIALENSWIWNIPVNSLRSAQQAAREALMSYPQPDLLLCMSDRIAQGAMNVAHEMGISIPDELRLVGFDDIPEAAVMSPTLTTVHQQSSEKGRQAARLFLGLESRPEEILTQLIVRESCP